MTLNDGTTAVSDKSEFLRNPRIMEVLKSHESYLQSMKDFKTALVDMSQDSRRTHARAVYNDVLTKLCEVVTILVAYIEGQVATLQKVSSIQELLGAFRSITRELQPYGAYVDKVCLYEDIQTEFREDPAFDRSKGLNFNFYAIMPLQRVMRMNMLYEAAAKEYQKIYGSDENHGILMEIMQIATKSAQEMDLRQKMSKGRHMWESVVTSNQEFLSKNYPAYLPGQNRLWLASFNVDHFNKEMTKIKARELMVFNDSLVLVSRKTPTSKPSVKCVFELPVSTLSVDFVKNGVTTQFDYSFHLIDTIYTENRDQEMFDHLTAQLFSQDSTVPVASSTKYEDDEEAEDAGNNASPNADDAQEATRRSRSKAPTATSSANVSRASSATGAPKPKNSIFGIFTRSSSRHNASGTQNLFRISGPPPQAQGNLGTFTTLFLSAQTCQAKIDFLKFFRNTMYEFRVQCGEKPRRALAVKTANSNFNDLHSTDGSESVVSPHAPSFLSDSLANGSSIPSGYSDSQFTENSRFDSEDPGSPPNTVPSPLSTSEVSSTKQASVDAAIAIMNKDARGGLTMRAGAANMFLTTTAVTSGAHSRSGSVSEAAGFSIPQGTHSRSGSVSGPSFTYGMVNPVSTDKLSPAAQYSIDSKMRGNSVVSTSGASQYGDGPSPAAIRMRISSEVDGMSSNAGIGAILANQAASRAASRSRNSPPTPSSTTEPSSARMNADVIPNSMSGQSSHSTQSAGVGPGMSMSTGVSPNLQVGASTHHPRSLSTSGPANIKPISGSSNATFVIPHKTGTTASMTGSTVVPPPAMLSTITTIPSSLSASAASHRAQMASQKAAGNIHSRSNSVDLSALPLPSVAVDGSPVPELSPSSGKALSQKSMMKIAVVPTKSSAGTMKSRVGAGMTAGSSANGDTIKVVRPKPNLSGAPGALGPRPPASNPPMNTPTKIVRPVNVSAASTTTAQPSPSPVSSNGSKGPPPLSPALREQRAKKTAADDAARVTRTTNASLSGFAKQGGDGETKRQGQGQGQGHGNLGSPNASQKSRRSYGSPGSPGHRSRGNPQGNLASPRSNPNRASNNIKSPRNTRTAGAFTFADQKPKASPEDTKQEKLDQ